MTSKDTPVSFDAIIQAGRERKKHEALANEIFGRGRRASAPGGVGAGKRKATSTPSLASRVGVVKRASSSTPKPQANIEGPWTHDLHALNNPQASRVSQLPLSARPGRIARHNRLYAALQSELPAHNPPSNGLSIRGTAGPFAVMASNFAPGTTASDIEAAMSPVGGEILSCRLISTNPAVMAEVLFAEKRGAEEVIATFNNQRADGRLLHVYMKARPLAAKTPASRGRGRGRITNERPRPVNGDDRSNEMDVDDEGRYEVDNGEYEGRLYSDEMVQRRPRYRD
ncbi:MAG: hypothetical protein M1823_001272 [Watsoniomyces obsoletus]|nr:MAG: hypothetical protein M1823_001272 [Watsoniomyces obsoletus]